jgi:elongation factor P
MATLGITDLKVGLGVNINGKDCVILEAQHVKPGKGNTYVRTKYRDIRTGRVNEENFQQSAKFESVNMQTREMQYLYNDGDIYYFMDNETYEQVTIAPDQVNGVKFMKDGQNVEVVVDASSETVLYVDVPAKVHLTVTWTEPGLKGDTATNTLKPAKVETGAEVRVPLFIEEGETIEVDTRDGSYLGRVK